jgi:hypothetical protein
VVGCYDPAQVTEFRSYLALAAFPIIGIFLFDWWNAGWASEHHAMVLPREMAIQREEAGRPLQLVKYGVLLLALRVIASNRLWHMVPFTMRSHTWVVLVAPGIAAGILLLVFRNLLSSLFPDAFLSVKNEYFVRGSVNLWLMVFLLGTLVEEFWRAVCISGFLQNEHSALSADMLTAIAFSIAHQTGLPSRIAPGLGIAGFEVLVGLILGALFIWSGNVVVPCLASVIYYVSSFFLDRRRPSSMPTNE